MLACSLAGSLDRQQIGQQQITTQEKEVSRDTWLVIWTTDLPIRLPEGISRKASMKERKCSLYRQGSLKVNKITRKWVWGIKKFALETQKKKN